MRNLSKNCFRNPMSLYGVNLYGGESDTIQVSNDQNIKVQSLKYLNLVVEKFLFLHTTEGNRCRKKPRNRWFDEVPEDDLCSKPKHGMPCELL